MYPELNSEKNVPQPEMQKNSHITARVEILTDVILLLIEVFEAFFVKDSIPINFMLPMMCPT